ncbi:DNA primase family protein [Candidatus Nitrosotenuis uzonensis]|uniref:Poxvirus D5 protein-like protein n=1 Tax=Candidatus Nitrosotenuis uzonensis TaxID=1407055 RepID=V6AQN3_9ARCH|nr:phage/plasmid primase, P4 family [Candidatus Nitrosotenuis uzonensis]CDI04942.1 putative Poxvirus D5 protein-like protein [Candidatus Nitrosotenuis uzonensis]
MSRKKRNKKENFGTSDIESREIFEQSPHVILARKITKDFHFQTLKDTEEILVYEDGIYKEGAEVLIKEQCQKLMGTCDTSICKETINTIKRLSYIPRDAFDSDPKILNVKNGLLNLETGELKEHTPDYPSRIQLSVPHNPKAKPERFMEFLMSSLPDHKDRTTVLEEFASILCPHLNLELIYVHLGEGANGKSTLFFVIEVFFGEDNVSNTSIHDLVDNKFARADLDGKCVNLYADIESDELKKMGLLKALASQDTMQAEKKFKNTFKLKNKARLFFSANRLPKLNDNSDGAYRRFIVTEWKVKFRSEVDGIGQKKNPNLKFELTTEEELSGILNLLIKVRKRLVSQKRLTYERSIAEMREEWQKKSDPIPKFIEECLVEDIEALAPKKITQIIYKRWCKKYNIMPESQATFNKELKKNVRVESKTSRMDGKPTKVWKGISLNPNSEVVTEVTDVTSFTI